MNGRLLGVSDLNAHPSSRPHCSISCDCAVVQTLPNLATLKGANWVANKINPSSIESGQIINNLNTVFGQRAGINDIYTSTESGLVVADETRIEGAVCTCAINRSSYVQSPPHVISHIAYKI